MSKKEEPTFEERMKLANLKLRARILNFIEGLILIGFGLWTALFETVYHVSYLVYFLSVVLILFGILGVLE